MSKIATKQAKTGVSPRSGKRPPKSRQFGQPNGNPRHNGAWKKEDTARYKLQQMIKMTDEELRAVIADANEARFAKTFAQAILDGDIETAIKIINQAEGMPKQQITADIQQPIPLVDLTDLKRRRVNKM